MKWRKHSSTEYRKKPISDKLKSFIMERDKAVCQKCGKQGLIEKWSGRVYELYSYFEWTKPFKVTFEIGHIMPESLGGELTLENLALMCRFCNRSLGGRIWHKNA